METISLVGGVSFATIAKHRAAAEAKISAATGDELTVDCSGLDRANGVTVALMLALFRFATHLHKTVTFRGVPEDLANIISFSGLANVLPLAND